MRGHHDFIQFDLNTLATDNLDAVSHPLQGVKRFLLYLEVQLGSKADTAHHTQRVVAKSHLRVQRCRNDSVFQIGNTIKRVYQFSKTTLVQADCHCIDSKVAPVLVVLQGSVLHNRFARIVTIALLASPHELHFHIVVFYLSRSEIAEHA